MLRATGGNFLEMFDFFLFGLYAQPIGKAFFDTGNEYLDTSIAFIVFWLGALMRPLGAIFLGAYVDRLGRRKGLIVTLAIMAIGTVIIAVHAVLRARSASPRRSSWSLGRLLQGFSAGVELGGVSVYLAEIATPATQGFRHLVPVGEPAGRRVRRRADRLRAQPDAAAEAIAAWGWRIPFLIGCLIVPLIFVLRGSLRRRRSFSPASFIRRRARSTPPCSPTRPIVLLGMLMVMLTTVSFYFITVYTPDFGKTLQSLGERLAVRDRAGGARQFLSGCRSAARCRIAIGRLPVLLGAAGLMLRRRLSGADLGRRRPELRQADRRRDGVLAGLRRSTTARWWWR